MAIPVEYKPDRRTFTTPKIPDCRPEPQAPHKCILGTGLALQSISSPRTSGLGVMDARRQAIDQARTNLRTTRCVRFLHIMGPGTDGCTWRRPFCHFFCHRKHEMVHTDRLPSPFLLPCGFHARTQQNGQFLLIRKRTDGLFATRQNPRLPTPTSRAPRVRIAPWFDPAIDPEPKRKPIGWSRGHQLGAPP